MIADQLKKIKKEQKSIMGKSSTEICFTGLHDVENETLLDLVPISTRYTTRQSLHFDRFRLSVEQEAKFNLKFSKFLMDLVKYADTPDIEYLYDFLIRRYHVQKFNPKEFIFVILLYREFYLQLRKIDRYASLQWFDNQEEYSTHFIADLCIKDKSFFSLFTNYYQYYQYEKVKNFVDEITSLIIQKTGTNVIKFISFFYEIIVMLVENEHREKAIDIFVKIKPFLGEDISDFEEILGEIEIETSLCNGQNISKPQIIENTALEEKFLEASSKSSGRKFLNDSKYLMEYLTFLLKNNLKDESFTNIEIEFLTNETFKNDISIEGLRNLLRNIDDQALLIDKFLHYPLDEVLKVVEDINQDHWKIVLEKHPFLFRHFINQNNYKEIEVVLSKHKGYALEDFIRHCIENHFLDIYFIENSLTKEMVLENINEAIESKNNKYLSGLLAVSYKKKLAIGKNMIERSLYKQPLVFDFIAKEVKRTFNSNPPHDLFLYSLSDETYLNIIGEHLYSNTNMSSVFMICNSKKSFELTNNVVSHVITNSLYSDIFIDFVETNLNYITAENICRFLDSYGYKQDIYNIIEKSVVLSLNEDNSETKELKINGELIRKIYQEEGYYMIYKLALCYGFEPILGALDVKDKREYVLYIYRLGVLTSQNMAEFLLYVSNNLEMKDKELLGIFVKEYNYLLGLKESKNWNLIKAIIIEGLTQDNAQVMFEEFFMNIDLFENDTDLLENITNFTIDLNNEIIDKSMILKDYIFQIIKNTKNAEVVDILIRKLSYSDMRIVPFVVHGLIKNRKPSVTVFFSQYKNIMAIYIKNVLEEYPEIYESLYNIDSKIVIPKIIEMCRKKKEIGELENRILSNRLKQNELSDDHYINVANLFTDHLEQVSSSCLYNLLTKYKGQQAAKLVELLFNTRYDVFIDIAPSAVKIMPDEYRIFVSSIIQKNELSQKEFKFMSEYLKYQSKDADVSEIIVCFDKFVNIYLNSDDRSIAKVVARSLNFVKDKSTYTKKLLKLLKEPHIVLILKLFQTIVRNTDDYKKQISLITPHLSLLVDSTKEQISSECHKFLEVVEKQYGFNPLIE